MCFRKTLGLGFPLRIKKKPRCLILKLPSPSIKQVKDCNIAQCYSQQILQCNSLRNSLPSSAFLLPPSSWEPASGHLAAETSLLQGNVLTTHLIRAYLICYYKCTCAGQRALSRMNKLNSAQWLLKKYHLSQWERVFFFCLPKQSCKHSLNWTRINLMNSKSRWKWFISESEALEITLECTYYCALNFLRH